MKKVVLGFSGGVDSAVCAKLLKDSGFDVHGLYMDNTDERSLADAVNTARFIGIPLEVRDVHAQLEERVCSRFAESYLRGETPNPCIICNPTLKFKTLLDFADEIGADNIATGHYARAENGVLYKGMPSNDQSYMLCRIRREQLDRLTLPLGRFEKTQVRKMAEGFELPVAHKPDSMEICFIPQGDYATWLDQRGQVPPPGDFVDRDGNVLGRHLGIHHYTIGQRRGLGIPAAHRLFVSAIRPEENQVVLSDGTDLMADAVWGEALNRLAPLEEEAEVTVRLRHSKTETPAVFYREGSGGRLELKTPARAPTPGQLAVLYEGETVLGSLWITKDRRV